MDAYALTPAEVKILHTLCTASDHLMRIENATRGLKFVSSVGAVEVLAAAGISAPKGWSDLRGRFANFVALDKPLAKRLATEIVSPTGQDIAILRALAYAE
jgi:hypothetical protein